MGIPVSSVLGRSRLQVRIDDDDDQAWVRHLATLDAHQPFRDFTFLRIASTERPR